MRTLVSAPPTSRVGRYPKHPFLASSLAFTAQPIMLARVLPGETLNNVFFESRVITDPVSNPIIGWKKEYFFFYIRISNLMLDAVKDMFVDPTNAEIAGMDEAANLQQTYAAKGGIDWLAKCMERIVYHHFRDEGEDVSDFVTADGRYIVPIRQNSFLDSLTDKDQISEGAAIAGATDAGDLDRLMDAFEMARTLGMANMSYEDFLRSYGISVPEYDEDKPELLCHFSDWQYPSNTINPSTGAPTSAVSFVFKNGNRDPKFFAEPGFVVGVTVTRPKVYYGGLAGFNAGFAQRAWDWMPNYLMNVPEAALKAFTAGTGALGDRTVDTDQYWIDMRDELLYGDQYHNVRAFDPDAADMTAGAFNMVGLPSTSLNWKYPSETMIKSMFVDAAGTAYTIREDGYVGLSIKGMQVDYTGHVISPT